MVAVARAPAAADGVEDFAPECGAGEPRPFPEVAAGGPRSGGGAVENQGSDVVSVTRGHFLNATFPRKPLRS